MSFHVQDNAYFLTFQVVDMSRKRRSKGCLSRECSPDEPGHLELSDTSSSGRAFFFFLVSAKVIQSGIVSLTIAK
jgi:hypothetical protein